ncbi:cytochrome c oxidase subunit II [soil metagenome]
MSTARTSARGGLGYGRDMAAPGRRRHRSTPVRTSAFVLVGTLLLSSCQLPRFGAPDPASEQGGHTLGLWQGFFLAAIVVTLTVWLPLAFVLLKYRRGKRAASAEFPSQRAYNIPMEIAYTVVPVLIVAALFFFSVRTEHEVTAVSQEPAVEVEVVGFQWGWQFRYLGEGFTVDAPPGEKPQLVLPIGAASNLKLVSTDVNHSFWVPNFLSKRDLIPGIDNEITVTPNRAGTFEGRCAEFCGLDHWKMGFTLKVVPRAEFDAWLAKQKAAGGNASAATDVTSTTTPSTDGSGG